ncbi:DinB family protein [Paenibacillus soyae]|uniref:DinB family protein n=1 Tax=Paenibacillus soyae TaxID=2969249 RepID=A0A9X2SCR7_9BACL|nr:DinB family protein [Paenibacillus soyae]MCR2806422.1 DinB family protein [Paenibacillus soyae]
MYNNLEQFAAEWKNESKMTEATLQALTDDSLSQAIRENRRTIQSLAWHLVASVGYMASLGLRFDAPAPDRIPDTAAEIAEAYSRVSRALLEAVLTQWSDDRLGETQHLFGEEWQNGASLRFTVMHQAHHRGQLTVLISQAGLRVPELYGPTYDSWIEKGMEPLA